MILNTISPLAWYDKVLRNLWAIIFMNLSHSKSEFVRCLVCLGLFIASLPSFASGLFEDDQALRVHLKGPLSSLIRDKENEKAYPFTLHLDGIEHQVRVRARGNSRKRVCKFPPLKLEMDKDPPRESPFHGQTSLKLVTHCQASLSAEINGLQEYAAYRFFNLLSPASFRVRLLQISYFDTDKEQGIERYGFVIEPVDALADRINGEQVKPAAVSLNSLNDQQEALVYVFQYLIGNTDWSLVSSQGSDECCHNGKIINRNQDFFYIPYDFDLSGLVNARYAYPDNSLPIKKVTQRLYRGFCLDQETLRSAIRTVRSREADLKHILDNLPGLSQSELKKMYRFVDRFFEESDDEEKILKSFKRQCHK